MKTTKVFNVQFYAIEESTGQTFPFSYVARDCDDEAHAIEQTKRLMSSTYTSLDFDRIRSIEDISEFEN